MRIYIKIKPLESDFHASSIGLYKDSIQRFIMTNRRKPVFLDLFSGLGGASEAFVQAGWTVLRIETNDKLQYVPRTLNLDVLKWRDWIDDIPKPDIIWASPPCRDFSTAFNAPRSIHERSHETAWRPNMDCLNAAKDIIDYLSPGIWIIENVSGSEKYFSSRVGAVRQVISSFHLYGNFPYLPMGQFIHIKPDTNSKNPLRSNIRAKIPFEISFELLKTWKSQRTLLEWI